jgi:hypothetical protein
MFLRVIVALMAVAQALELSVYINNETERIMEYDFTGKSAREMGDHCSSFILKDIRNFEFPRELKRFRNVIIDLCTAAANAQNLAFDVAEYFQFGGAKRNDMTTIFDKYPTGAHRS